jgi:hypothetical protein
MIMFRPFSTLAVGILIGYFGVPFVLRFAKR